jgi:hypothetical protein
MFSDFWLQSANNGEFIGDPAASGAEIDICEHRGTDATNTDNISGLVTIDIHWDGYTNNEKSASSGLVGSRLGTGFHTYGLLWNSTNYNVSLDGVPTYNTNAGISERTEILLFSSEVDSNSFCGIVPPGRLRQFPGQHHADDRGLCPLLRAHHHGVLGRSQLAQLVRRRQLGVEHDSRLGERCGFLLPELGQEKPGTSNAYIQSQRGSISSGDPERNRGLSETQNSARTFVGCFLHH